MKDKDYSKASRKHPDYYMRAQWHDYTSRCLYMVTFNKAPDTPALSNIKGKINKYGSEATVEITQYGLIVSEALQKISSIFPHIKIGKFVIMPDHLHIIIFVTENKGIPLGEIIRRLKKECTLMLNERFPELQIALRKGSMFANGFNDRIVHKAGMLEKFRRYIEDNPRRFYLKRCHPEFFNRAENICINNQVYSVYGNFLLLRHPEKEYVRISSKFSEKELVMRKRRWHEIIRGGGVLISPFISRAEKEIMHYGIKNGASIIRIVENGFPERYKPSGEEFNLCSEGRLLIIAPVTHRTRTDKISRAQCLEMNALAEALSKIESESLNLIISGRNSRTSPEL